jgi:hypothetical protein
MSRDLEYYERKVRELQVENEQLKGQLNSSARQAPSPQTFIGTN